MPNNTSFRAGWEACFRSRCLNHLPRANFEGFLGRTNPPTDQREHIFPVQSSLTQSMAAGWADADGR
jgi:hypothetical protein